MLKKFFQIIGKGLFWAYERGSWQYDLMCLVILLFIFLTPRDIFHDRPQEVPPAFDVVMHARLPASGVTVYRVRARLLAHNPRSSAEELLHKKLHKKVEITHIEPVTNEEGAVLWYDVAVRE